MVSEWMLLAEWNVHEDRLSRKVILANWRMDHLWMMIYIDLQNSELVLEDTTRKIRFVQFPARNANYCQGYLFHTLHWVATDFQLVKLVKGRKGTFMLIYSINEVDCHS